MDVFAQAILAAILFGFLLLIVGSWLGEIF